MAFTTVMKRNNVKKHEWFVAFQDGFIQKTSFTRAKRGASSSDLYESGVAASSSSFIIRQVEKTCSR
jgi:hypothetical protein